MSETLSREQEKFLEECNFEFCNRFTDSDVEYKKVYDSGIPPPPILYPWYGRLGFANRNRDYRDRNAAGSGRRDFDGAYRERRYDNNYRGRDGPYNRNRFYGNRNRGGSSEGRSDRGYERSNFKADSY